MEPVDDGFWAQARAVMGTDDACQGIRREAERLAGSLRDGIEPGDDDSDRAP